MKALHCDRAALNYLWATTPAAPPPLPGTTGDLFGIPVITDPELPFSGWQLRDGDEVLAEGQFFEAPEATPSAGPFAFNYEYDLGDWRRRIVLPLASHDIRQALIVSTC